MIERGQCRRDNFLAGHGGTSVHQALTLRMGGDRVQGSRSISEGTARVLAGFLEVAQQDCRVLDLAVPGPVLAELL